MDDNLEREAAEKDSTSPFSNFEEPLRTELRGIRRLEEFAAELGRTHKLLPRQKDDGSFFKRFEENARLIRSNYHDLGALAESGETLAPSEEWLVDNYYLVAEQIREIREDLPREFYEQLPRLDNFQSKNYLPRIFVLAENLIAETDSLLDKDSLTHFIRAYQRTGVPLTIGEIWALPIALRLILIENLRRVAVSEDRARESRRDANELADQILETKPDEFYAQIPRLQKVLDSERYSTDAAWLVQVVRRLRNQNETFLPLLEMIEKKLRVNDYTVEQIFVLDQNQTARAVVTIGNIISSFRWLNAFDWSEFFERVSRVDEILRNGDPLGVYAKMDFQTRDRYRQQIERAARRGTKSEIEIAHRVVEIAREAAAQHQPDGERRAGAHIGYYLVDDGRDILEHLCDYRPTFRETIERLLKKYPKIFYFATIFVVSALFTLLSASIVWQRGGGWAWTIVTALLAIVPAMTLAVSVINWDATKILAPTVLPKMNFSAGVPADARALIVIPTMFTDADAVREIVRRLEVHYLSNSDENFYFALLSDFGDAATEEAAADAELLRLAETELAALNARYSRENGGESKFHLFHRRRVWSDSEGKWMGWERKRGKIEEFNRYLRGAENTSLTVATLDRDVCASVKYVITLDGDTKLPPGAARKLAGIIAHPLNQPRFAGDTRRIERGYAILQPRVSITAESTSQSVFARIMAGFAGLDPYTTAVSDVYQDLFGAGIYTGKGLYVVDAFERALERRVPPASILSHDLFESIFARTALVSDVEFFDDFPAIYEAHAKRLHRWVRGDWQLLPWLGGKIPAADGKKITSDLSIVAQWKIFDNLRRSLIAPSIFLSFAAAWIFLPAPLYLTVLTLIVLAFPVYAHVSSGLLSHPRGVNWENRLESFSGEIVLNTLQFLLTLIFLPHQCFLMIDAILRTLNRVYVSRRLMLEWQTAAQIERASRRDLASSFRFMRAAVFASLGVFALVLIVRPEALPIAVPFLALWLISPFFAYYLNQFELRENAPLSADARGELRSVARQTWRFFQSFINADNHFLPPDNFQEDPAPLVARRTSPTNIGLLFLANVAGHDFGYLGLTDLIERTEKTLETTEKLEKFHGHLLNWYDTETLAPLNPKYVSTVDSGNLAGHLIALKQSLLEKTTTPVFAENLAAGLADGWREAAKRLRAVQTSGGAEFAAAVAAPIKIAEDFPAQLAAGDARTAEWTKLSDALAQIGRAAHASPAVENPAQAKIRTDCAAWLDSYAAQIESLKRDAEELFAWRRLLPATGAGEADGIRSLTDLSEKLIGIANGAASNGELAAAARLAANRAQLIVERAERQAARAEELARAMDFKFLINKTQGLFSIGYNVSDNRLDNSCYDLLASEARLASFWAIAKGDAPPAHWFKLGRAETMLSGGRALVSWSGTMFEYLMPLLVMKTFTGTLLDQTYRAVVERQIEYGDLTGVPWGISEAGYNARDLQLNYQYGPFGVPGLGLKRGLNADLVIAPYATLLATLVAPETSLENLRRLANTDALGNYGFYESLDFTPERLPENKDFAVVKNYMAHHQGMSFLALGNALYDNVMQERFHRDAAIKAIELLLQERAVQNTPLIEASREDVSLIETRRQLPPAARRVYSTPHTPQPHIQVLSNRNYSVMLTNAGGGFSTCENLAVTRWREDATTDAWGSFIYLSDARDQSKTWSATYQPTGAAADFYEAAFTDDRAVFRRGDYGLITQTEIIVSSEDNVEMRQVTLINPTDEAREIYVTSYAEIVLNTAAADAAHPAFSNLFVETEFVASDEAIIARRRPRSTKEREIFGVHVALVEGRRVGAVEYETDRAKFLGRNRTAANPAAIFGGKPLSKTAGAVIDPVFSLRYRLLIPAQSKASICFSTGIAFSREEILRLADKYNNPHVFERESAMAWTKARVEQRHLQVKAAEAAAFQTLAARLVYSSADFRAANNIVRQNNRIQSNLWAYGVSGDLPILLVKIKTADDITFVKQMLRGQEYLRLKNLKFDLVIINLHPEGYAQNVQEELNIAVRTGGFQQWLNQPGGIFLLRRNMLPDEDIRLFEAIARLVFNAESGTIVEQLKIAARREESAAPLQPTAAARLYADESPWIPPLKLFNGTGGFSEDGREYVISLKNGRTTPAPWLNVIANEHDFGFQISESGAGYTWSVNSRENRLTTWTNDAVSDTPSEAFYLRDDETGAVWSPTPAPIRTNGDFVVKHGQGYTQFLHNRNGISHDTLFFVPLDAPVKIAVLRIENKSGVRRRLSLWNYTELVLGVQREKAAPTVVTAIDTNHQVLFAYNRYNNEFANRSAFLATNARIDSHTCDRREFIGRNGSPERPAALSRANLLGRCNPKLDPCFATHSNLQLEAGEVTTIVFLLGETENDDQARDIVQRYRRVEECYRALDAVKAFWDKTLTRVEIKTPDESANLLVNRWLLYQTLACRVWARSAFYQSGGAIGFRDQLQDVMSLVHTNPQIVRNQILTAAARQFKEGDVQHWWHPPTGRGVRTRISDDLLWLPFVTAHYLNATHDTGILDVKLPFLEARELNDGEEDMYIVPDISDEEADLFEHCRRAIERGLKFGAHDLPLMGSGDWNDGMNQVGLHGKGESVWLGWFLCAVLREFAPICEFRGAPELSEKYLAQAETVRKNIEANGWDGEWYRRAYFDDGTPLGSATNDECKIDAIAQSWSVISGAGDPQRSQTALDSVEKYLVRRDEKIILLFDPPFDHGALEPGYIKGYVPGVRENGGQYAHGALWTVIAYALSERADLSAELFAMINPINHSRNETEADLYKNEPYVFTADIHNTRANAGRGGWSWYTGSAGWAYRAVTEFMYGLHKRGDKLLIEPHFPRAWDGGELIYRYGETIYQLRYTFAGDIEKTQLISDGEPLGGGEIPLNDDGRTHYIEVRMPNKNSPD